MALRESALLLARRGAFRRALRALDESLAIATQTSARVEFAASLYARGELRVRVGQPGGAEDLAEARALLDSLGATFLLHAVAPVGTSPTREPKVTLSLADRFDAIVDVGRRIASAHSPDDVFDAASVAAETLLRGERCEVVFVDHDELRARDEGRPSFSRTLVRRALEAGTAIVRPATMPDDVEDTTEQARLRSSMCFPVYVRGRVIACLCVHHQLVGGLFGEDERRLAEYIATLAGASLERAEAFAEIQAFTRSLEERVEERTTALRSANEELDANLRALRATQEQLVQSGKLAAVGTLVAGLSHEINNPIAVILGHAQAQLRKLPNKDPLRRPMEAIERQALRSASLVRTLLDFARQSTGERTRVSVEKLLDEIVQLSHPLARRADVRLEGPLVASGTPELRVCKTEIESTVLNLVSNAIDASPRGSKVEVRASPRDEDGRAGVSIEVKDAGPGIPPDVLPRIFDPFFTTKPEGKGTGLGLSLARQIVDAHGGTMHVDTREGEGTTMRVWLPAAPETGGES
jgi:two-component system sensor kinase